MRSKSDLSYNVKKSGTVSRAAAALLTALVMLTGCGKSAPAPQFIFTTGFEEDEVFRLDDAICSRQEILIRLVNEKNSYIATFGDGFLESRPDAPVFVKNSVMTKISQQKAMRLMAEREGIVPDAAAEADIERAANEYFATLTDEDKAAMEITDARGIESIYRDMLMADRIYEKITGEAGIEVSDDEARSVTVEQIVIYDDGEKDAEQAIRDISRRLASGDRYELLMQSYNEAEEDTVTLRQGEMESAYEKAAFSLMTGEVSDVVQLSGGYCILKSISSYDKEETKRGKEEMIAMKKREVFREAYDAFVAELPRLLNEKEWNAIDPVKLPPCTTTGLEAVYRRYFPQNG